MHAVKQASELSTLHPPIVTTASRPLADSVRSDSACAGDRKSAEKLEKDAACMPCGWACLNRWTSPLLTSSDTHRPNHPPTHLSPPPTTDTRPAWARAWPAWVYRPVSNRFSLLPNPLPPPSSSSSSSSSPQNLLSVFLLLLLAQILLYPRSQGLGAGRGAVCACHTVLGGGLWKSSLPLGQVYLGGSNLWDKAVSPVGKTSRCFVQRVTFLDLFKHKICVMHR